MSMKKITDVNLETTAKYQPLSQLGVRFWNQDFNTAELRFIITRNNFPLSLSKENVKVIIALESGKNFIASDEFIIDSEVDGVARFPIPSDFMQVATDVVGQVYVTTLDGEETIVERQFSFQVSNDLLANIPSEESIRYIKMFDDLKQEIQDRIQSLEEQFMVMEDYVVLVNQATIDGLAELNSLIDSKTIEYNDNHDAKLALINTTVGDYVTDFLDQRTYIDTKYTEFQTAVEDSGLVTEGDATNWQKYKMTNEDGSRIYLNKDSFSDINALPVGLYETVSGLNSVAQGFPTGHGDSAYTEIDVTVGGSGRKQIKVVKSYDSQTWVKHIHTDGEDKGWKQVLIVDDVATIETVNGSQAKSNIAENNSKSYVDSKFADTHEILFSGSVQNTGSVVNLSESLYNFEMVVISGSVSGNDFSHVMIPSTIGSVVNLQNYNLRDSDGLLLGMYECRLLMTTNTKITITNDVAYDHPSDSGSGPNRNAYTIQRVDGFVRK